MSWSQTVKLTKAVVDRATPDIIDGKVRQRTLLDTELTGFGVVVGSKTKTFIAQRKIQGRTVRVTVGRYGALTVDQARNDAREYLAQMGKRINPNEVKRAEQAQGITLREALDLMLETAKTKSRSPKTIKGYRYAIETYLSSWLDRPLAKITRKDIYDGHRKIAKDVAAGKYATVKTPNGKEYRKQRTPNHGRYTANGVMRAFRAVYNRALRQHDTLPANPTIAVDWFPEQRRDAAIPTPSLATWYKDVTALTNAVRRDYLLFVLFTGLRRQNAAEMRWEHVDLEQRLIHVPKPKSGRPFDLPLSDYLLELLKQRRKENGEFYGEDCPWVFPATSKTGHISEPKEKLSVPWTVHGLRNTFITVAESLDISPYAIKMLVNHSVPHTDVTGGYIQADVERLRVPMQSITDKLKIICTSDDGSKVVRLPTDRRKVK